MRDLPAAVAWAVLVVRDRTGADRLPGGAPGAATIMVLMSEGFGGDPRLVAYMQFLRVMLVGPTLAGSVSRWASG